MAKDIFVKSSAFVELSVLRSDSYTRIAENAAEALSLPESNGQLRLFKVKDGVLILNREIDNGGRLHKWSIGLYCSLVVKKKPNVLKIGVGYIKDEEVRMCSLVSMIIYCCLHYR